MAFEKYHVVKVGQSAYIDVKPETLNGESRVRMGISVGSVGSSVGMSHQEVVELISCLAESIGVEGIEPL